MSKKNEKQNNCYLKLVIKNCSINLFVYTSVFIIGFAFLLKALRDAINETLFFIFLSVFAFIIIICFIIVLKPIKNTKSKSVGYLDATALCLLFAFCIVSLCSYPEFKLLITDGSIYAFIVCLSITGACLLFLVARGIYITISMKKIKPSALHIKDVFDGKLPDNKESCLLKDESVPYDLIGRIYILNRIESALDGLLQADGGSIALVGDWGSGKTTLLRNILADEKYSNCYLCDSVNPWDYSDQKSLFVAVIDGMFKTINIHADTKAIQKLFEKYASLFLSNNNTSFLTDILDFDSSSEETPVRLINDYLYNNNKSLICVFDDLDRATKETILLTYKIIANILKIKRVVFICAFSEKRTKEILNQELISYDFLEKVFSLVINVPAPSSESISFIGNKCLTNYLMKFYKKEYEEFDGTDKELINVTLSSCDNLREFIILFNAVSNVLCKNNKLVNLPDLIAVEYLKGRHDGIADLIKNNPQFFLCCHKSYLIGYDFSPDSEKERKRNDFYKENFEYGGPYYKYGGMLDLLFPNYRIYAAKELTGSDRDRAEKGKRIYSGKYFETYFEEQPTDSAKINEEISNVLSINDFVRFVKELDTLFDKYPHNYQKPILEQIRSIKPTVDRTIHNLLWYLLNRYKWFNDEVGFFFNSSRTVSVYIISELLSKCSDREFSLFEKEFNNDYSSLVLLNKILQGLEAIIKENGENEMLRKRYDSINNNINLMCDNILSRGIRIYHENYYDTGITWILYNRRKEKSKDYIKSLVNSETILPFMNDFIYSSVSNKIKYSINLENVNLFFDKEKAISKMNTANVYDKNGMLVKQIFEMACSDQNGEEEKGLVFDLDNQPNFHYDFFNKGWQHKNEITHKPKTNEPF